MDFVVGYQEVFLDDVSYRCAGFVDLEIVG